MKLFKNFSLLMLIFSISACSAIQLNPQAEKVRLTTQEPIGCEFLAEVTGFQESNVVSSADLAIGARNDLKNNAADLGATHVHILMSNTGVSVSQFGGGTNSVVIHAAAFKCPLKSIIK